MCPGGVGMRVYLLLYAVTVVMISTSVMMARSLRFIVELFSGVGLIVGVVETSCQFYFSMIMLPIPRLRRSR